MSTTSLENHLCSRQKLIHFEKWHEAENAWIAKLKFLFYYAQWNREIKPLEIYRLAKIAKLTTRQINISSDKVYHVLHAAFYATLTTLYRAVSCLSHSIGISCPCSSQPFIALVCSSFTHYRRLLVKSTLSNFSRATEYSPFNFFSFWNCFS